MAGAVRQPIDVTLLEAYVQKNVPEIQTPIDVKQFGFGQSNPTYQLTDSSGKKFVLRKKPPGILLSKTAHKVEREYRIIHALEKTDVPVPKAYCLCTDDSVIGTPFYIMSFLDGRIFEDPAIPGVSPAERTEMWHDAVRTLAKLHRVDPKHVELENYGRPSGFYDRQIATLQTVSESQAKTVDVETGVPVGKIIKFDEMMEFFKEPRIQPQDRGTIIHGDYKIDNVVYHKTEPRVIGVLDWEMSTIGHPLSDLSNLQTPYINAKHPIRPEHPSFTNTFHPGLPPRDQTIRWYAEHAGWDPRADIGWGDAFACLRNVVIMQGIAARLAQRQASSEKAREYAEQMPSLGQVAWMLVKKERIRRRASWSRGKL
ncbi:hypothetical protein FGG08_002596 [Glutinoglossum americanum]|uniref:Aminoglycoside phosphotransferase domain-containing protein n=1 Tax=Glutinoglossum americanum TaxID=1670608 RepID=A0A9P8IEX1_9PEZI|nr:hypothetical protein FGG08_002596 [Glutinoglossum americanum]